MRSRLRFHLATRAVVLTILLCFSIPALAQQNAQDASSSLPKAWTDAVSQLADKIAASTSPATPVALDVRNISSLDESYASAVQSVLENELRRHSFRLVPAASATSESTTRLQLALSENADQYVWVVRVLDNSTDRKSNPETIVSVPKADFSNVEADGQFLSLEKRLIWQQPEKFLDFALARDSSSGNLSLLVLETNRFALYKMSDSRWNISHTNPIPQTWSPSRDLHGEIDLKKGSLSISDLKCVGAPDLAENLRCDISKPTRDIGDRYKLSFPEGLGTILIGPCHDKIIFLFTGDGDWTQSDSIQGYLTKSVMLPVAASGSAVQFEGPVIYLQPDPDANSARAIVHNLKTGNYEAYIVTATCH